MPIGFLEPANCSYDVATNGTLVTTTTSETDLGVDLTIPSAWFDSGKYVKYNVRTYTNSISSSPGTLTFKTYLNSTLLATTGALSLSNSEVNVGRSISYDIVVITGNGGQPAGVAFIVQVDGSVNTTYVPGTSTVTSDTTASQILKTTATFSVSNSGNNTIATQATVVGFG